jgi:type IV pilus assembly protein PilY1
MKRFGLSLLLFVSTGTAFAQSVAPPPNLHFIVDTSGSMRELPQIQNSNYQAFYDATVNGCQNPALDAFSASHGWDPTFPYPVPDTGTGIGTDTGFPHLFQDDKFYAHGFWSSSSSPAAQWASKEAACQSRVPGWSGTGAAQYTACLSCLGTQGYFKVFDTTSAYETNANFILWGRFLNFNPPKYVAARAALKQVFKNLSGARAGLSIFTATSSNVQKIKPSCSQLAADPGAFASHRADFIARINALTFNTSTPLARALLNAGYYFTSDQGIYRDTFGFGFASPTGYSYPADFKSEALTSDDRTVCWGEQRNAVILIADGGPNVDTLGANVVTQIRARNGHPVNCPSTAPCPEATQDSLYMLDDVAKLLSHNDLQRSVPNVVGDLNTFGQQSLNVHTVGVAVDSNLLKNAAYVGGGTSATADTVAGLQQAIEAAIAVETGP